MDFLVIFDSRRGFDTAGDIYTKGTDIAHGTGNVLRSQSAAEEDRFVRKASDGFNRERPVREAARASKFAGSPGIQDECLRRMILQKRQAF